MENKVKNQNGVKKATRQRLLEAACAVFAERGYRDATIQEICDRAGANVAAVNYHFGDKERLYGLAWRYAYDLTRGKYPLDGGGGEAFSAEERLGIAIRAMLGRIFDPGPSGYFPKLLLREMAEPTGALAEIVEEVMRPNGRQIDGIINKLLGQSEIDHHTHLCTMSALSQCVFFSFNRHVQKIIIGRESLRPEEIDYLAEHILRFVLAGIREVREWKQEHEAS